jgi:uncharacterized protein YbbK (DUF523 family)
MNVNENKMIRIGVSSCLLDNKVRYDGGHKHDRYITETLGNYFQFIARSFPAMRNRNCSR